MTQQNDGMLTGVGRLVQGSLWDAKTTDINNRPLVDRNNNPRVEYYFGLAIPKTAPETMQLLQFMQTVASSGFPNLPAADLNTFLSQIAPTIQPNMQSNFSWKLIDGDNPNYSSREGHAGNYILKLLSGFAPNVYQTAGKAKILPPEPNQAAPVKRGDFVRVYLNIRSNGDMSKPGLYLNHQMVEFIAYGDEIHSGPDAAAVFGGTPAPAQLPPGASSTPIAPATSIAPAGQPAVGMPAGQPAVGMPAGQPTNLPTGVTPATNFLNNQQ